VTALQNELCSLEFFFSSLITVSNHKLNNSKLQNRIYTIFYWIVSLLHSTNAIRTVRGVHDFAIAGRDSVKVQQCNISCKLQIYIVRYYSKSLLLPD